MTSESDPQRFANLGYEDFRRLATEPELSRHERVGFPDSYREGKEAAIFHDIRSKMTVLDQPGGIVLDIGPGCSDLPKMLFEHCRTNSQKLLLVDSTEMLDHLPDDECVEKWPAYYPDCPELFERYQGRIKAVLTYSVFQYVFAEANIWRFVDRSMSLLAPGGQLLIGDLPNVSKRKRFFASATGARFHRAFTGRDEDPSVLFNTPEPDQIDDAVVFSIVQRARAAGYDAYILPQAEDLPMANRREDLLITRP